MHMCCSFTSIKIAHKYKDRLSPGALTSWRQRRCEWIVVSTVKLNARHRSPVPMQLFYFCMHLCIACVVKLIIELCRLLALWQEHCSSARANVVGAHGLRRLSIKLTREFEYKHVDS